MAARILGSLLRRGHLWNTVRIVVAGYSITPSYVEAVLGEHAFLSVQGRVHDMLRVIVAPRGDVADALPLAAHLAVRASSRSDHRHGAVMVFLPGMQEILEVEKLIKNATQNVIITLLHSDIIGNEDEETNTTDEANALGADPPQNHIILSSIVGARSVTYYNLKYVLIHPHMRSDVLGASGLKKKTDKL
eukprot:9482150-Pyramimonas_sp.AAC.1